MSAPAREKRINWCREQLTKIARSDGPSAALDYAAEQWALWQGRAYQYKRNGGGNLSRKESAA